MLTYQKCILFIIYFVFLNYTQSVSLEKLFNDYRYPRVNDDTLDLSAEESQRQNVGAWKGRWMPSRFGEYTPPPKVFPSVQRNNGNNFQSKSNATVQMGSNLYCDNGQTNLTTDWDNSPVNYTCFSNKLIPDYKIATRLYCEHIPIAYVAIHKCMSEVIEYDEDLPLYGTHRPVWPVYGEYKFLPRQRWLHSLEHGAVVMLYHPCANPQEVKSLKNLVTGCIRRHVISPYNLLDEKRPLALLTWGCSLTMSYVQPEVVQKFIKQKALRGSEEISDDGEYKFELITKAKIVSDIDDTNLCPNMNIIQM